MSRDVEDRRYMARALRLAARGLNTVDPNPRVGCVLVRDGQVVGEGWHVRAGEAHAEVHALRQAGAAAAGATAYVTLEPCGHQGRTPPCTDALIGAGVARVVYAMSEPNGEARGGAERLKAAGIAVSAGVLAQEAAALNPGFLLRHTRGTPLVRSKLAVSLDGRTALADGRSRWITGEAARRDVQRWRARSSVILTGIGTILTDDPLLNVRLDTGGEAVRQPLRVVLDSELRTPPTARLFSVPGQVMVLGTTDHADRRRALESAGARVDCIPGAGTPELAAVLARLAALEANEVWIEAGEALNGALLSAGLIDELVIYMAAHVLGSGARGMFALPPLADMADRPAFQPAEVRRVGDDLRLIYGRKCG